MLVFSSENREDLLDFGYESDRITVNSSRIHFPADRDCNSIPYAQGNSETLQLLFIGRIDSNYRSILNVLGLVKFLKGQGLEIELNVLGDGQEIEKAREAGRAVNSLYDKEIVWFKGYCSDVHQYIDRAHMVFGKGRSILDAIAHWRISFVASETGHLLRVNPGNIEELSHYNLTGRNAGHSDSFEEISDCVKRIQRIQTDVEDLYKIKEAARAIYDVAYAEEKVMKVYQDALAGFKPKKRLSRLVKSIRIIVQLYANYLLTSKQRKTQIKNHG